MHADSQLANRNRDDAGLTASSRIPVPFPNARKQVGAQISFTDTYGYRGCHPDLYYLCPWEFTKWWRREPLHAPNWYSKKGLSQWTEWTESGLVYQAQMEENAALPAATPGTHYIVSDTDRQSYIVFPDLPLMQTVRHRWVLVRQSRPDVPQPIRTPFLKKTMELEERGRILSLYLRPWTLLRDHATPHVPHLSDLDVVLTSVLAHKKRHTGKQRGVAVPPVQRSFAEAWDDYRKNHIVSKHALQLIRNFVLTQMPNSIEGDDEEVNAKKQPLAKVFTPWASPDAIEDMLARTHANSAGTGNKHQQALDKACEMTRRLWGLHEDENLCDASPTCTHGHISSYTAPPPEKSSKDSSCMGRPANCLRDSKSKDYSCTARLRYGGLTRQNAEAWFTQICTEGVSSDIRTPRPRPNTDQQKIIRRVMERCMEELHEEAENIQFRSEPFRFLLHGVPGAGKSEVLYWLRNFFEDVCLWVHGQEFAYLASQNSMAALIGGSTFHSFMGVPFMNTDGVVVNRAQQKKEHGTLLIETSRCSYYRRCCCSRTTSGKST